MYFEIVGPITDMETIAAGRSIRQLSRLRRQYGQGRWRKLKGIATVRVARASCGVPRFTGTRRMESDAFATRLRGS